MKKLPVSIALLAATGAASAQSAVTIFGIIDAGISYYSAKSTAYNRLPLAVASAGPSNVTRSQTALSSGNYLPSRIGFRGTEDLGGGLAASFWLESPMSNDDGATAMGTFARRSTVSLSGAWGEVRLGRDYTPTFWNDTIFDPFNNIGVGANLIGVVNGRLAVAGALSGGGLLNGGLPSGPDNYVRTSNSVGYFLPKGLGGLYGQAIYAINENTKINDATGTPSKRGHLASGRLGFANGPLDVALTYTQSIVLDAQLASGLQAERKLTTASLGASYDLGAVKFFGEVSQARDKASNAVQLGTPGAVASAIRDTYNGAMVGLTAPVGAGLIRFAYSRVKFKDDATSAAPALAVPAATSSASKLALGYVHYLSKRTLLYATISRIRITNGQNNPAVMGATTGPAPFAYVATGSMSGFAPRSSRGYDFGVSHSF